jgi:7,8-dihydropterin-6-yl-methyl-4-(beta-D-ribofuranosyl)aminobenzene 5'-phosphate synthase
LDNHLQLSPQLWLVFNRCHDFPVPKGNLYLSLIDAQGSCIPYGAEDEISVAIVENQHLHILASCSHNGILNIIRSCQKVTGISDIATYIGGLHLLDDSESENSLQTLASEILKQYPNLSLHTGHCTGSHAKDVLQKALKNQFHTFCTGEMIEQSYLISLVSITR